MDYNNGNQTTGTGIHTDDRKSTTDQTSESTS